MIKCPECNRIIMDVTNDGGYKVRTRMLLLTASGAEAICPQCKNKVDVPLALGNIADYPVESNKYIIKQF